MTVPIVSKKSISMIEKIVRIADRAPRTANAWNGSWRPRPSVEKFGVHVRVSTFDTPTMIETIVVVRMLMIRAALTFRAHRMIVRNNPNRNTYWAVSVIGRSVTAGMLP